MSFLSAAFLTALVAAAGPTLIHLLNRRRHRTVEWAAMDFLREAVRRNKKLVEIRDLILLILRTAAVIFFVLAMARPYWVSQQTDAYQGGPVHAVIVIDNSLSMGYEQLGQTQLDVAKEKAKAFVETLPKGSAVSLVPMVDQPEWHVEGVSMTQEDAAEDIDKVQVVDRSATTGEVADRAKAALGQAQNLPTKRVVFIGDMQETAWDGDLTQPLEDLGNVQVVDVAGEARTNTWVADFRLRDGVADAESPAVFIATIRHEGDEPRTRQRVTLKIGDNVAEERFVDLLPGQPLELRFKHTFDVAGTSAEPLFIPARIEVAADRLATDDFRAIVVPVVAQVPVVFIDQHGQREQPRANRYGETYLLRRLLAPRTERDENTKQLVDIRHHTVGTVTRDDLKDARMVVIAGVQAPTSQLVQDLREYAEQGGQVLIAAGAKFDPAAWHAEGWADGAGILPAPLRAETIGQLPPPTAADWPTFRLAANTFKDAIYDLDLPEQQRRDLLLTPFFYEAVAVDTEALGQFADQHRARLEERYQALADYENRQRTWQRMERAGGLSDEEQAKRDAARQAIRAIQPDWLTWAPTVTQAEAALDIDQLVARETPRVLGQYDSGEPFAVRRRMGKGQVIMVTSGAYPVWNNIAAEHSVLLFDQMLRHMLALSLPHRTLDEVNAVEVPIPARDQAASFTLLRPGDTEPLPLEVNALGENSYGLRLDSVGRRGVYEIRRLGAEADQWTRQLAINGPADESELKAVDQRVFTDRYSETGVRWVSGDDQISLEGEAYFGHSAWKYLLFAALACLVIEMVYLTPAVTRRLMGQSSGGGTV